MLHHLQTGFQYKCGFYQNKSGGAARYENQIHHSQKSSVFHRSHRCPSGTYRIRFSLFLPHEGRRQQPQRLCQGEHCQHNELPGITLFRIITGLSGRSAGRPVFYVSPRTNSFTSFMTFSSSLISFITCPVSREWLAPSVS